MNPNTRILEEREELLIIDDGNGITTIPKSDYYLLRIKHYNGNRIFYDWGADGATVKETYNDGIFNCWLEGRQVQIADASGVSSAILEQNVKSYKQLFEKWFEVTAQEAVIDLLLEKHITRVAKTKAGYEIDGVFMVNKHGVSHCIENEKWRHLCLVAVSTPAMSIVVRNLGRVTINPITSTIMAKINFLLNPNMKDRVFTSQLTEQCKRHLKHTYQEVKQ